MKLTRFRWPQRKAVMVTSRQYGILHPRFLSERGPFLRIIILCLEVLDVAFGVFLQWNTLAVRKPVNSPCGLLR